MVLIWIFYLSKLSLMNIYDGTRGVHQRKEIHVLSPEKKMVLQYTVLLKWKNNAEKLLLIFLSIIFKIIDSRLSGPINYFKF